MEEEHYRKVYIKSESDLPKNKGAYIVSFKGLPCVSQQFYDPESKGKYGYSTIFLNQIDWYLQPEQPIEHKSIPELCPICKTTFLTNRVCLTCTRKLCSPLQIEQSENNKETVETEFQKRFELLRLQKILNDHIIIDPDKLYVSLRGIEIAFDALVKSENNEIQHGIPFKCPECGKEIQFGFSDAGMKLFAKSRLFEQSEIKTAEEIIIKKVGEFWWICGKHKPEFLEAMEEYRQATQPKPPEKITDEEIREKLSQMCFCKSLICKRCGFEEKICNNEEIRKDIFKYLTEMEEYRQYQPTVSDEEIENGVTELARKYVIQSVGDWAIGYITGAKAMRDNPEQFKMK